LKSSTKVLLLSVILALITAVVFMNYLKRLQITAQTVNQQVPVVVAARDIPARTKITPDMLEVENFAAADVPAGAYRNPKELLDHYTAKPLVAHEMIFPAMILKRGNPDSFSLDVPPGERAISISYTETKGVGGHIVPGDRVDVLAVFSRDNTATKLDEAKIILQNVEVLAVGVDTGDGSHPSVVAQAAASTKNGGTPLVINTVTLAVTPEQAESLGFAEAFGQTRLLLRPPGDNGIVATPGVNNTNASIGR
jgi:pilus assembly protein CpaB